MSESCPNCGSAVNENSRYNVGEYQKYECGCMTSGFGDSRKACPTQACRLIRSLRDELAGARDAERDRIADWLELRASKLEDELAISETSTEIGLERILAVIKSLRKEAMALRNNEHRSDT